MQRRCLIGHRCRHRHHQAPASMIRLSQIPMCSGIGVQITLISSHSTQHVCDLSCCLSAVLWLMLFSQNKYAQAVCEQAVLTVRSARKI